MCLLLLPDCAFKLGEVGNFVICLPDCDLGEVGARRNMIWFADPPSPKNKIKAIELNR